MSKEETHMTDHETGMTTKTRYYCAMSLDGFIAESDDTLDWLLKYEGTGWEPGYERFYSEIGAPVSCGSPARREPTSG
jgi:hypothetical protein